MTMTRLDGANLEGQTLDGEYVYGGGDLPILASATFTKRTAFSFNDAASRTISVLALLDLAIPGFANKVIQGAKQNLRHSPPGTSMN
jgi:hypothetical protein